MENVNMENTKESNRKELSEEETENIFAAGLLSDLWYWTKKIFLEP